MIFENIPDHLFGSVTGDHFELFIFFLKGDGVKGRNFRLGKNNGGPLYIMGSHTPP